MNDPSRPPVSVVVPFAGDAQAAAAAVELLRGLQTQPGDELILADNCGTVSSRPDPVTVVRADGERSPSHARNVGAAHARREWILFLDADVQAPGDLLSAFFAEPIGERVGAITGDIRGIDGARTLAARYGASRNFLGQRSHVRNHSGHERRAPTCSSGGPPLSRPAATSRGSAPPRTPISPGGCRISAGRSTSGRGRRRTRVPFLAAGAAPPVAGLRRRSRLACPPLSGLRAGPRPQPGAPVVLKQFGIGPGLAFRADGRTAAGRRRLSRWDRAQFFAVDAILAVEEQIGLRMSNETRR